MGCITSCNSKSSPTIADQPTTIQIAGLKETFDSFDKDGDGVLNPEEFLTAMRSRSTNRTDAEIQAVFKRFDADGNGVIDWPEFQAALTQDSATTIRLIREMFNEQDKDGDGFISVAELKHSFTTLDFRITDEDIDRLMKKTDINDDGKISYEEFFTLMTTE